MKWVGKILRTFLPAIRASSTSVCSDFREHNKHSCRSSAIQRVDKLWHTWPFVDRFLTHSQWYFCIVSAKQNLQNSNSCASSTPPTFQALTSIFFHHFFFYSQDELCWKGGTAHSQVCKKGHLTYRLQQQIVWICVG